MKEYNFLIGVPRAGNTVISSVLNQNEKICLTANSPLSGLLYELDLFKTTVKTLMEGVIKMKIPLSVDIGYGKNWLEAH